ncbi:MAG TPA: Ig-like domain-containing protein, partial [Gemmatimonadales bacterium]|nr:Ig-like domain-containing protein [Gemmatimonadales bacterium]
MIRPEPTRFRFPIAFLLALISSLVGCGGGDSDTTGPDEPLGGLTVTGSTSGPGVDPDGYVVQVDGLDRGTLIGSNSVTVSGLAPGSHTVGLGGVATNCLVEGDNPRTVPIPSGATASVAFTVLCSSLPPGTGSIQVVVSTSGPDPDPDGYVATLDGVGPGIPVPTTGSATFPGVVVGSHTVALSGLASNCTASGAGSATTNVSSGAASEVSFTVTCTALPPTVGAIRISTSTTGSDLDADGYQFAIDGGAAQSIAANGQVRVNQVSVGAHTVVLSGIADNCSVTSGASQTVSIAAGQTADVAFSIECSATRPSATRSTMLADPKIILTGESSTITVTVRNSSGGLLEGVPVTPSASGSGNTIAPQSASTDANGVATFTFSSTTAED